MVLRYVTAGLLLATAGVLPTPALADGGLPSQRVQLSASGAVEVPQDLMRISLTTTREAAEAATVQQQLKQALDAALAEARREAQPGQLEVRTGSFSLVPRYGQNGRINGWQGSAELVLEGRDFARISALAGRIPALTVGQVQFRLSRERLQQVEGEAQSQAVARFKAKAQTLAQDFGFGGYTLGEVSVQTDGGAEMPPSRPVMLMAKSAMAADAPVPVEAGRSTVQVTVSGAIQLR